MAPKEYIKWVFETFPTLVIKRNFFKIVPVFNLTLYLNLQSDKRVVLARLLRILWFVQQMLVFTVRNFHANIISWNMKDKFSLRNLKTHSNALIFLLTLARSASWLPWYPINSSLSQKEIICIIIYIIWGVAVYESCPVWTVLL